MTQVDPPPPAQRYTSFREFYPFYLGEHRNATCRRLHVVGTTLVLLIVATALLTRTWPLLLLAPLVGYGFSWAGHFFFERNLPAAFKQPFYSLLGDFAMLKDVLTGRVRW